MINKMFKLSEMQKIHLLFLTIVLTIVATVGSMLNTAYLIITGGSV